MTTLIAGVDEAGRGPLAGPLVVAAVILDPTRPIDGLADSKALTESRRETLAPIIRERALAYRVIVVSVGDIDRLNIFQATMHGMRESLRSLAIAPTHAQIDGNKVPKDLAVPAEAIVGGDAKVAAISAASILAKVERDRLMLALDAVFPDYGFAQHKGYPTPVHLQALRQFGPCAEHRRSFAPVRDVLSPTLF